MSLPKRLKEYFHHRINYLLKRAITHIQNEILKSFFTYRLEVTSDNSNSTALLISVLNLIPELVLFPLITLCETHMKANPENGYRVISP